MNDPTPFTQQSFLQTTAEQPARHLTSPNPIKPPRAKKALGQHFLTDEAVVSELIGMMCLPDNATVVEVGPGPGILTRALTDVCDQVIAVELDPDMITYLGKTLERPNLSIYGKDILKTDLAELIGLEAGLKIEHDIAHDVAHKEIATVELPQKLYVASNLPYQISSPFLFHMIEQLHLIAGIGLMLQKEVVDRMAAPHNHRDYGRLSVMMQFYFELTRGSDVPASAFSPPPAVESALITLSPKALSDTEIALAPTLSQVVKQAFSQRRKTLRNTLKPLFSQEQLEALGLDPSARPQTVPVADYVRLAAFLQEAKQSGQTA